VTHNVVGLACMGIFCFTSWHQHWTTSQGGLCGNCDRSDYQFIGKRPSLTSLTTSCRLSVLYVCQSYIGLQCIPSTCCVGQPVIWFVMLLELICFTYTFIHIVFLVPFELTLRMLDLT